MAEDSTFVRAVLQPDGTYKARRFRRIHQVQTRFGPDLKGCPWTKVSDHDRAEDAHTVLLALDPDRMKIGRPLDWTHTHRIQVIEVDLGNA
jgi:hypothetical protein